MAADTRTQISKTVAEIAFDRGVSERTVWRWVAVMRASGSDELLRRPRICEECDEPLPEGSTIRRRYCRPACRVRANRRKRRASSPNNSAPVPRAGIGSSSSTDQSPAVDDDDI
jgi:hypothetical protein